MGFWASKTLLSAVELELFTRLGGDALTAAEIAETLGLHARAVPDFPDALVALGLLDREGDGSASVYRNPDAGAAFLDKASPTYMLDFARYTTLCGVGGASDRRAHDPRRRPVRSCARGRR